MRRMEGILDRGWLTNNGPLVAEFEEAIASIVGVRHCVATCNGTLALEIAIRAVGLEGEVITTPFTFVGTAHALQWQGITPVFCDVDPRTHNIDPAEIEALITPRTTGILGVHLWGRPCDVEALTDIADRHGLALLFDAAHAFGCSHRGRMIGGFGRAEVFSFHATKYVNAFEGGALVTDDDEVAARARLMRNFGFADYDRVDSLGTNGKMTEVSAAMGLTSLESRSRFVAINHRNWEAYRVGLDGLAGVTLAPYDDEESTTRQYVVIEVDDSAGLSRDDLQRVLWAENVLARRYFHPGCHRSEPYASACSAGRTFPETDRLVARVLTLPTGTSVTTDDIAVITGIIRRAQGAGEALTRRLAAAPGDQGRRRDERTNVSGGAG
ncbi:aminotransferase class I/II-fold pyridoxal phosphate-dependent enzyme [Geodermatophilus sp. SYSU D00696]